MAFFGVTLEEIESSITHPNADRLDICRLRGIDFQFVAARGQFLPGDRVVYFPIDSLLPEGVQQDLGLVGKLSGRDKNRVKTIRLRGELSQGLVSPLSLLEKYGATPEDTSQVMTTRLGVRKYDPPVVISTSGLLLPLPLGLSAYDIEGSERYPAVVERLLDLPVYVNEKVEGTNLSVTWDADARRIFVNQRNYTIQPLEDKSNVYWETARSAGLLEAAEAISKAHGGRSVTLYGELCGPSIQSNIYKLREYRIFVFDVRVGSAYLELRELLGVLEHHRLASVPLLAHNVTLREFLAGRTIKQASDGPSFLADTLREGIVIRPMTEAADLQLGGRLIIKQRSPLYLASTEN